jgi:ppGpp synthetase/RelA/SpoT-type nucleotidyltranferase
MTRHDLAMAGLDFADTLAEMPEADFWAEFDRRIDYYYSIPSWYRDGMVAERYHACLVVANRRGWIDESERRVKDVRQRKRAENEKEAKRRIGK